MKLVMAIVRPNKVTDVTNALEALNLPGLTVTEVRGHGRQRGHTAMYRGKEYDLHLLPKVKIETVVPGYMVDSAVDAITTAARTGEIGDGRVWVIPVERSTNIRTGETETESSTSADRRDESLVDAPGASQQAARGRPRRF